MRIFLALAIAGLVLASGVYSVACSVKEPGAAGTYAAHTTGAASRIEWSDRINAGFDE